ncbi:MAG: hypothetical protein IJV01_07545 [Bacteroidales bacterium]|nr:hypothetical protein [Bacteroidales bacterium]
MKRFLFLLAALVLGSGLFAQDLARYPYHVAAGHNPYEVPEYHDTPAPKGYVPVYVSHFGRHGSRYQTSSSAFKNVLPLLDSLQRLGFLTPQGDSLRQELAAMAEAHKGHEGLLTERGAREHRGIASRLARRVPGVFRQKNAPQVTALSTTVPRCIRSRGEFVDELGKSFPKCVYSQGEDERGRRDALAVRLPKDLARQIRDAYAPVYDSLLRNSPATASLLGRLINDRSTIRHRIGKLSPYRFAYTLLEAAQGAACLDLELDPLRFFTTKELESYIEVRNIPFCARYGAYAPGWEKRVATAAPLWRRIVKEADAALAGNGHCADLRFGHDSGLGPLLNLLGVEGYDKPLTPLQAASWPAWKYIPMCSNLQLIFYRNKAGDVLVKILRNENETGIPGLEAVSGPYYRWSDLRRHILCRAGGYRDLPAYYPSWLDGKAAEIAALKKGEASGFFFWTDVHFPDNAGNSGAVLEYLQEKLGPQRLFFGGDATLNGKSMYPAMDQFETMMMQANRYGTLCPVRGNHDYTSHTHEKKPSETMTDAQTAEFQRALRTPAAVGPDEGCYYYVDDKAGKIRYLVFDSTDSVQEGRVVYGVSKPQFAWMREQALATLPKGWDVVVFSHVPFAKNHTKLPSHREAEQLISTLKGKPAALICLSGHRHSDMEGTVGGVFQVLTAADELHSTAGVRLPYSKKLAAKKEGSVNEQTIDYVSVSKKHDRVTMLRLGHGNNRIFNLRPVEVPAGKPVQLVSSLDGAVDWFVFDAPGGKVEKPKGKPAFYACKATLASIDGKGSVSALGEGLAVAVATAGDGTREFFLLRLQR